MDEHYDVVVVGGGAAGLTAGLFAVRYGLKTLLLEEKIMGGQVINAEHIENFPGLSEIISGAEILDRIGSHAAQNGLESRTLTADSLAINNSYHVVETSEGRFECKALILAGGSSFRTLDIPGEESYLGRGVSHCATCDGFFFQDESVAVIGGGDSAFEEALILTKYAERVLLFHNQETFQAQQVLQKRVSENKKIELHRNSEVTAILGENHIRSITVKHCQSGEISHVPVTGVFIYVGLAPNTQWLPDSLSVDYSGHIPVGLWMETTVPGIFAAGDIRQNSAAQLITAAGDGATAAIAAHRYVSLRKWS